MDIDFIRKYTILDSDWSDCRTQDFFFIARKKKKNRAKQLQATPGKEEVSQTHPD